MALNELPLFVMVKGVGIVSRSRMGATGLGDQDSVLTSKWGNPRSIPSFGAQDSDKVLYLLLLEVVFVSADSSMSTNPVSFIPSVVQ